MSSMPVMTFKIGDIFDAADPVARFIAVLATMSNDWLRLFGQMDETAEDDLDATGMRIMSFRHQASLHHEAADFIRTARQRFPEVRVFVEALDDAAREACDRVAGGADPKSAHYLGAWLEDHRNVTFHYAKLHPDAAAHNDEEIAEALKAAAGLTGTITEDDRLSGGIRFGFADEIVAQWLPDAEVLGTEWLENLRESVLSLGVFTRAAVMAYLAANAHRDFEIS